MTKFSFATIIVLGILSIFADFFAPYNYATQFREYPSAPPMRIHLVDKEGGNRVIHIFAYEIKRERGEYVKSPKKCYLKFFRQGKFLSFTCPVFLFGTDSLGRDIFSRILYGGRISLSIGLVGVTATAFLGLLFGSLAGYFGGKTDMVIMRLTEVLMSIPSFFLLLALSVVIPPGISSAQTFLLIVFILSFVGWAGFARVIRGMVASIRTSDYVSASISMGAPLVRTIFYHIVPQTLSYTIVVMTLSIPGYILGESALSMLGLGIREPDASWGNMLSEAMNVSILSQRPWTLLPGLFIFLTVVSFNVLGEYLREKTNQ